MSTKKTGKKQISAILIYQYVTTVKYGVFKERVQLFDSNAENRKITLLSLKNKLSCIIVDETSF